MARDQAPLEARWSARLATRARSLTALAVLLVAAAGAGAGVAYRLAEISLASRRLPQWDMAKYGLDGVRLARAVRHLDPVAFLAAIDRMSLWPPVFPLLELPAFLAFGDGYRVPAGLVAVLFAATVPAALWAGSRLGGSEGWIAGGAAAALFAASPLFQVHGTVVMLEVPCALVLFLAAGAYLASLAAPEEPGRFRLACLLATLLFFTKYNAGLLWLAPLLANEAWSRHGGARGVLARLREGLRRVDLRRPWHLFLVLYALLLLAIAATGGWTLHLGPHRIPVRSLGNPVYLLYLVVVARLASTPRRSARRLRDRLAALPNRARTLALWTGAPVALWMLLPGHVKDFFEFVENRSSGLAPWSPESLLFYPRVLVRELAPHPAIGVAALLLGLAPIALLPRLDPGRRVLALAVAVASLALLAHPYKLPRFASALAPVLWLSAGAFAGRGLARGLRRLPARLARPGEALVPAALALAALVAAGVTGIDRQRVLAQYRLRSEPPATRVLLDRVSDLAAAAPSSVLAGYWNGFSPALVEWHLAQRHPAAPGSRAPRDVLRVARTRAPRWGLDRLARAPEAGTVLVVLRSSGRAAPPGWAEETRWVRPFRRALAADGRFVAGPRIRVGRSGYRLWVYRRREGAADRPQVR